VSDHQPRKRFGQNFLVDRSIIERIVKTVNPQPDDNLIEIGPGLAAITEYLVARCPNMQVIELDRDLVAHLQSRFVDLAIHSGDALKMDYRQFYRDGAKLRLVGNLPYNISTPLLFHLLSYRELIADMHFMLQKEVVDRLGAQPGSKAYGRLSVMIQYHCKVMPVIAVPPGAFRPPPKVQSAVVKLTPHLTLPFIAEDTALLGKVVAHCFGQRRKTLRNGLKPYAEHIGEIDQIVDLSRRAEQLSVAEFVAIANHISQSAHRAR
jgi:16S rRNA (adenine1518-N6/adenine1519-N6)-dimethyltransferase